MGSDTLAAPATGAPRVDPDVVSRFATCCRALGLSVHDRQRPADLHAARSGFAALTRIANDQCDAWTALAAAGDTSPQVIEAVWQTSATAGVLQREIALAPDALGFVHDTGLYLQLWPAVSGDGAASPWAWYLVVAVALDAALRARVWDSAPCKAWLLGHSYLVTTVLLGLFVTIGGYAAAWWALAVLTALVAVWVLVALNPRIGTPETYSLPMRRLLGFLATAIDSVIRRAGAIAGVTLTVLAVSGPSAGAITPPEVDPAVVPPSGSAGPVQPMAQRGECIASGVIPGSAPDAASPNQLSLNLSEAWRHSRGWGSAGGRHRHRGQARPAVARCGARRGLRRGHRRPHRL